MKWIDLSKKKVPIATIIGVDKAPKSAMKTHKFVSIMKNTAKNKKKHVKNSLSDQIKSTKGEPKNTIKKTIIKTEEEKIARKILENENKKCTSRNTNKKNTVKAETKKKVMIQENQSNLNTQTLPKMNTLIDEFSDDDNILNRTQPIDINKNEFTHRVLSQKKHAKTKNRNQATIKTDRYLSPKHSPIRKIEVRKLQLSARASSSIVKRSSAKQTKYYHYIR